MGNPKERSPRRRWLENIRMDLQEVYELGWPRWRTLVSAVMNLRVP